MIKAGFGSGEIIFPVELLPVEGFSGIHDYPHVRVMYISTQTDKMVLIALELVNVPAKIIDFCRELSAKTFGLRIDNVWVHMTHAITTPHEPGPMGPPDKQPDLTEEDIYKRNLFDAAVTEAVINAIESARIDVEVVSIGWNKGLCDINCNRDIETPWGWWIGNGGDGYSDHEMTIMKAINSEGKTKGVFVSFGMKPCAIDNSGMNDESRQISSEVCGIACSAVEDEIKAPVIFVMSAAADQIPVKTSLVDSVIDDKVITHDEGAITGFRYAAEIAGAMSDRIIRISEETKCQSNSVKSGWENLSFAWPAKKDSGPRKLVKTPDYEKDGEKTFTAELFRLGDAVFIAERPEVNAITGKQIKEESPFAYTVLMTMVNGEMKYLPDQESCDRCTWEAQSTKLMPGAAERFVKEAGSKMNKLYQ